MYHFFIVQNTDRVKLVIDCFGSTQAWTYKSKVVTRSISTTFTFGCVWNAAALNFTEKNTVRTWLSWDLKIAAVEMGQNQIVKKTLRKSWITYISESCFWMFYIFHWENKFWSKLFRLMVPVSGTFQAPCQRSNTKSSKYTICKFKKMS